METRGGGLFRYSFRLKTSSEVELMETGAAANDARAPTIPQNFFGS